MSQLAFTLKIFPCNSFFVTAFHYKVRGKISSCYAFHSRNKIPILKQNMWLHFVYFAIYTLISTCHRLLFGLTLNTFSWTRLNFPSSENILMLSILQDFIFSFLPLGKVNFPFFSADRSRSFNGCPFWTFAINLQLQPKSKCQMDC